MADLDQRTSSQRLLLVDQKKELLKAKHSYYEPKESGDALASSAPKPGNCQKMVRIVVCDPISILLLALPVACISHFREWDAACTFWLSFLAMIPLAKILGDATEELADGLRNETLGGLLNATFGNAVEMILTIQNLRENKLQTVKDSLLGSILSNLLLVLGMSFCLGGLTRGPDGKILGKEQLFSKEAALTNMTMLLLATSAFSLPTVFFANQRQSEFEHSLLHQDHHNFPLLSEHSDISKTLMISRYCSIYLLMAYIAFLVFQLYTHREVFQSPEQEGEGDDEDEGGTHLSPVFALGLLFMTTLLVTLASDWLVKSINGLIDKGQFGGRFVGMILLPIVGNACEHAGAVRMAMAEKVDITIGIAVGSSTQIALFVTPFSVIVGWIIGRDMDLNFGSMDITVMVFAVLVSFSIMTDGASNWLEGFMLMVAYAVVATLFWFATDEGVVG